MAQMSKPECDPKIFPAPLQSLQDGRDHLLVSQSLVRMEDRREASFKVNDAIAAQILGLFIRDAL